MPTFNWVFEDQPISSGILTKLSRHKRAMKIYDINSSVEVLTSNESVVPVFGQDIPSTLTIYVTHLTRSRNHIKCLQLRCSVDF